MKYKPGTFITYKTPKVRYCLILYCNVEGGMYEVFWLEDSKYYITKRWNQFYIEDWYCEI